jgi:hypothetical protein
VKKKPVIDEAFIKRFIAFMREGWSINMSCKKAGTYPRKDVLDTIKNDPLAAAVIRAYYERVIHPTKLKNKELREKLN